MDNEYVEFTPPKGFVAPEGEDSFDLVCTFKVRPNGMLYMTKLGNTDMPQKGEKEEGEDESEEERYKPSYGEYHQGMMDAGQAGGMVI